MTYIAILIILGAFFYIFKPIYDDRYRKHLEDAEGNTVKYDYFLRKKSSLTTNMKDLEFEYQMGKVSEEDYQTLRQEYIEEKGIIEREMAVLDNVISIEAAIEQDIAERLKTGEIEESTPSQSVQKQSRFCPYCGTAIPAASVFCHQCGKPQ